MECDQRRKKKCEADPEEEFDPRSRPRELAQRVAQALERRGPERTPQEILRTVASADIRRRMRRRCDRDGDSRCRRMCEAMVSHGEGTCCCGSNHASRIMPERSSGAKPSSTIKAREGEMGTPHRFRCADERLRTSRIDIRAPEAALREPAGRRRQRAEMRPE
jgi:hypothetical protein